MTTMTGGELIAMMLDLFHAPDLLSPLFFGDCVGHQILEHLRPAEEIINIFFKKVEKLVVLGQQGVEKAIQFHEGLEACE